MARQSDLPVHPPRARKPVKETRVVLETSPGRPSFPCTGHPCSRMEQARVNRVDGPATADARKPTPSRILTAEPLARHVRAPVHERSRRRPFGSGSSDDDLSGRVRIEHAVENQREVDEVHPHQQA